MRIIQPNSWSCLACVAAMATGTSLNDFMCYVEHDGSAIDPNSKHPEKRRGFYLQEFLRYLIYCGLYAGTNPNLDDMEFDPDDMPEGVLCSINMKTPAMLVVKSKELEGCRHIVYWNGRRVMDPSPRAKDSASICEYIIKEWWPIMKITP